MDLSNIKLKIEDFSNGGPLIAKAIDSICAYRDGHYVRTEIIGRKVTVVLPANHYDTLTVRVEDPIDVLSALLEKAEVDSPIYVSFEGFEAGFRNMRNRDGIWVPTLYAKATAVKPVLDDNFIVA